MRGVIMFGEQSTVLRTIADALEMLDSLWTRQGVHLELCLQTLTVILTSLEEAKEKLSAAIPPRAKA
jgi:hypothetical protein